jgi:glycosyltransferase involved in cell wall biosynthesis
MGETKPAISIVTPSFNMLPFLKRCAASVRDQGVRVEHVVMDGGSTDGTSVWLEANTDILGFSEKDKGMYHALNKAIRKSSADIIGHLNCDEQYLPGTLQRVLDYFDEHPEVDFIAGDFLIVSPTGKFLAYRKSFQPRWPYFFSNYLYTTTCTLFYRRTIFDRVQFDESYRSIADVIFLYRVMRSGFQGKHVKGYTATFMYSGQNLSLNPVSEVEKKRFLQTLPAWFRVIKPLFFVLFYLEKLVRGNYRERPGLTYEIYDQDPGAGRTMFRVIPAESRLPTQVLVGAPTYF